MLASAAKQATTAEKLAPAMGRLLADAHDRWRGVQHYPADPQSLPSGDRLDGTARQTGGTHQRSFVSACNRPEAAIRQEAPKPPFNLAETPGRPSLVHQHGRKPLDLLLPM